MSSGRPSIRVHHEDVDDDDFRPHAPARDQNLRMAPAADQDDHKAQALEKTKRLKTMFDMDAPKWDQELEKDDKKTTWQDDEKTPTRRPTRSEYPVNID